MISQKKFLEKYNYTQQDFESTGLIWKDLQTIYDDYLPIIHQLESTAEFIFNSLRKIDKVHSVKFRIKDPEHLIEKIIRKKKDDKNSNINLDNYKSEITDLIGLRVLHLFKFDFEYINEFILKTWDFKSNPIANHREGDNPDTLKRFQELGFELKVHKAGYRSLHYIVETILTKQKFYAEIQVRTIYEEAWSEIDHIIRYPYYTDNPLINENLQILNRFSGNADEMGTHVIKLKAALNNYEKELDEKDKLILSLEKRVESLDIAEVDKEELEKDISKLKRVYDRFGFEPASIGVFDNIPDFSKNTNLENYYSNTDKIMEIIRNSTKGIIDNKNK